MGKFQMATVSRNLPAGHDNMQLIGKILAVLIVLLMSCCIEMKLSGFVFQVSADR
eukprot:m.235918 g.235918  ORF g.235918 m.235918 type:complete len:55 (+) comp40130_c0_seq9:6172-6336(+)